MFCADDITAVVFDYASELIATASRDKTIHVWHNAAGMRAKVGVVLGHRFCHLRDIITISIRLSH